MNTYYICEFCDDEYLIRADKLDEIRDHLVHTHDIPTTRMHEIIQDIQSGQSSDLVDVDEDSVSCFIFTQFITPH